jgi:hypothetical protein
MSLGSGTFHDICHSLNNGRNFQGIHMSLSEIYRKEYAGPTWRIGSKG